LHRLKNKMFGMWESIEARDVSLIQRLRIDIWQYELPCLRSNVAGVASSFLHSSVLCH
jgi:hypothetical protein